MQLAKNLWLRRDKTLGRKVQEFFLAQALESCFTKDQILELYLNVVEFGPDLYGIGPAAERYFKVSAAAISPVQAFWLASILPRPRSAVPPDAATLERIRKLMTRFAGDGKIPEAYLEDFSATTNDSEWGQ
jgi:membrane peptidoglycan carboxypeptidase